LKIPISVLVVIHQTNGQVLLIERADKANFWQSVTGSLDADDEDLALAAAREVQEETGIDVLSLPADALKNMQRHIEYEIYPQWRHRYAPGVVKNIEHWFAIGENTSPITREFIRRPRIRNMMVHKVLDALKAE
jgi:dATP pyrophosphohydrolase